MFWNGTFKNGACVHAWDERSSDGEGTVLGRLERWLCEGPAMVRAGPEAGAVAGRIALDGRPDYAYPEITGYFLTWLAFLHGAGETQAVHRELADCASDWAGRWAATSMETRVHLRESGSDEWRNRAIFLFDVAMLIRGLAQVTRCGLVDPARTTTTLARLTEQVMAMRGEDGALRCLRQRGGSIPDRWSTRGGPFLVKALASILHATQLWAAPKELTQAALTTLPGVWPNDFATIHPDSDHAALYFVEGVLLGGDCGIPSPNAESHCQQIIWRRAMRSDNGLNPGVGHRHDVLAQWLRASLLMPPKAIGEMETHRQRTVAMQLSEAVTADGWLPFGGNGFDSSANVWCAMFAHQALWLDRRKRNGLVTALPAGCLV